MQHSNTFSMGGGVDHRSTSLFYLGALGAALTTKEPPWEPLSSAFKRLLERLTAGLFFTRHKYGDFYGDLGSVPRNFPFLSCYVFQSRTGDGNVALGPTLACMHARCSVGPRLGLREPCPWYRPTATRGTRRRGAARERAGRVKFLVFPISESDPGRRAAPRRRTYVNRRRRR